MHLRPPSVDPGVQAFLWAFGLGLFIFLGSLSVGVNSVTALIFSAVAAGAIFLYVSIYGEERPGRS